MAIKTWSQLANNELVAHAEVKNAVSSGQLQWWGDVEPTLPNDGTGLDPNKRCYTWGMFSQYVRNRNLPTNINPNEYPSKSEMINYRWLPEPLSAPLINASPHSVTQNIITLSPVGTPDMDGYRLEYRLEGQSTWNVVYLYGTGTLQFTHNVGIEAQLAHYRARTYREEPDTVVYSSYSPTVSARTMTATPNAPSNANFVTHYDTIHDPTTWYNRITWTDNASNGTGFQIQRQTNGGSYITVSTTSANVTAYNDTDISDITDYRYRVRTQRVVSGQAAYSGWSTSSTKRTNPAAPSNLSGTALSPTTVNLTWQNNSQATQVRIYRDNSLLHTITSTGVGNSQSRQVAAMAGTSQVYAVAAYDSASNTTSIQATVSVTTPVSPPSGVWADDFSICQSSSVSTRVRVTWSPGTTSSPWRTIIERGTELEGWEQVADLPSSTTQWYDTESTLLGLSDVRYRVFHYWSGSGSTSSTESNVLNNIGGNACPTGVPGINVVTQASCQGGQTVGHLRVTWTTRTGWNQRIDRSVDGGSWQQVATPSSSPWDDTSVTVGTSYRYRVRYQRTVDGINSYGPWNTSSSVTYHDQCAPQITSASWIRSHIEPCPSIGEVHCVRWNGNRLTTSGYHAAIYRSTNGGSFSKVRDNVSLTASPPCGSGGGAYGVALSPLPFGWSTSAPGSVTDSYQYQVRAEVDGSDTEVSRATTTAELSTHNTCIL